MSISSQEINQVIESSQSNFLLEQMQSSQWGMGFSQPSFSEEFSAGAVSNIVTAGRVASFAATIGTSMGLSRAGRALFGGGKAASTAAKGFGAARIAGGLLRGVAGMAPVMFLEHTMGRAIESFAEGASNQMAMDRFMQQVGPLAGEFGGQSVLSQQFSGGVSWGRAGGVDSMRQMGKSMGMDFNETLGMAGGMLSSGMLGTVSSPQELMNSFRAKVAQVKEFARMMDVGMAEAAQVLSSMQQMGISSSAQVPLAAYAGTVSGLTGFSLQETLTAGAQGVEMSNQVGISPEAGFRVGAASLSSAAILGRHGAIDPTLMNQYGGPQGIAAQLTAISLGATSTRGGQEMLARMVGESGSTLERMADAVSGQRGRRRRLDPYELSNMTEEFLGNEANVVLGQINRVRGAHSTEREANRAQFRFLADMGIDDPRMQQAYLAQLRSQPMVNLLEAGQAFRDETLQRQEHTHTRPGTSVFDRLSRAVDDLIAPLEQSFRSSGQRVAAALDRAVTSFTASARADTTGTAFSLTADQVQSWRSDVWSGGLRGPANPITADLMQSVRTRLGQTDGGRVSLNERWDPTQGSRVWRDLSGELSFGVSGLGAAASGPIGGWDAGMAAAGTALDFLSDIFTETNTSMEADPTFFGYAQRFAARGHLGGSRNLRDHGLSFEPDIPEGNVFLGEVFYGGQRRRGAHMPAETYERIQLSRTSGILLDSGGNLVRPDQAVVDNFMGGVYSLSPEHFQDIVSRVPGHSDRDRPGDATSTNYIGGVIEAVGREVYRSAGGQYDSRDQSQHATVLEVLRRADAQGLDIGVNTEALHVGGNMGSRLGSEYRMLEAVTQRSLIRLGLNPEEARTLLSSPDDISRLREQAIVAQLRGVASTPLEGVDISGSGLSSGLVRAIYTEEVRGELDALNSRRDRALSLAGLAAAGERRGETARVSAEYEARSQEIISRRIAAGGRVSDATVRAALAGGAHDEELAALSGGGGAFLERVNAAYREVRTAELYVESWGANQETNVPGRGRVTLGVQLEEARQELSAVQDLASSHGLDLEGARQNVRASMLGGALVSDAQRRAALVPIALRSARGGLGSDDRALTADEYRQAAEWLVLAGEVDPFNEDSQALHTQELFRGVEISDREDAGLRSALKDIRRRGEGDFDARRQLFEVTANRLSGMGGGVGNFLGRMREDITAAGLAVDSLERSGAGATTLQRAAPVVARARAFAERAEGIRESAAGAILENALTDEGLARVQALRRDNPRWTSTQLLTALAGENSGGFIDAAAAGGAMDFFTGMSEDSLIESDDPMMELYASGMSIAAGGLTEAEREVVSRMEYGSTILGMDQLIRGGPGTRNRRNLESFLRENIAESDLMGMFGGDGRSHSDVVRDVASTLLTEEKDENQAFQSIVGALFTAGTSTERIEREQEQNDRRRMYSDIRLLAGTVHNNQVHVNTEAPSSPEGAEE